MPSLLLEKKKSTTGPSLNTVEKFPCQAQARQLDPHDYFFFKLPVPIKQSKRKGNNGFALPYFSELKQKYTQGK